MIIIASFVTPDAVLAAVITVGLALAGLVIQNSRANRRRIDDLAKSIEAMGKLIVALQTQISPFWASLQSKIVDSLHHPGAEHKELDELLEKLQSLTLTEEEKVILKSVLENLVANAPPDAAQKASMLLEIIPMVEKEAAGELPPTDQRTIEQKKEAERVNGAPA